MSLNHIVHRDLKLENILINFPTKSQERPVSDRFLRDWDPDEHPIQVTIGDLGFARKLQSDEMVKSHIGTPLHMAPQVLFSQRYDLQADIWSLGTIVYQLLVGFTPFTGYNKKSLARNIKDGNWKMPRHIEISIPCFDLIDKCLKSNPKQRISHQDLLGHAFFRQSEEELSRLVLSPNTDAAFDPPMTISQLDDDNSTPLNIHDSSLFNREMSRMLRQI